MFCEQFLATLQFGNSSHDLLKILLLFVVFLILPEQRQVATVPFGAKPTWKEIREMENY